MSKKRFIPGLRQTVEAPLYPGVTQEIQTTSDTVKSFTEAERQDSDKQEPVKAVITTTTNGARYAFGVDAASGGLGHPFPEGEKVVLWGHQAIKDFRIINDTGGQQVTFSVTFFYANKVGN